MFHNKKYPKDKKYGDTLALKNIWGHFANKKYMGQIANTKYMETDCHQYKVYGNRLPIQIWGQTANKNIWGQITNKKYMGTDCK